MWAAFATIRACAASKDVNQQRLNVLLPDTGIGGKEPSDAMSHLWQFAFARKHLL